MIPPAFIAVLALLHDRARLLEELEYISRPGCDGSPACSERHPCAACVARYAIAGWQLHHQTRGRTS